MCGVCVGGGGRVFDYTYIYSQTGRPCEVAELVGVLVAKTIHPVCMCEGGGRGGEGRAFNYTYIYGDDYLQNQNSRKPARLSILVILHTSTYVTD